MGMQSLKGLTGGGGVAGNDIIETFTAGEAITAGDFVAFINGKAKKNVHKGFEFVNIGGGTGVTDMAAEEIDETHALVIYRNITSSVFTLHAVIFTFTDTTISKGTPIQITGAASGAQYINSHVKKIPGTTIFLATYFASSATLVARCITVNPSTYAITLGTEVTVDSYSSPINFGVAVLSDTKAFAFTKGTASSLSIIPITISGTTLTVGTSLSGGSIVPNTAENGGAATAAGTTKAFCSYLNSSNYLTVCVASWEEDDTKTIVNINSGTTGYDARIEAISSTKAVAVMDAGSNTGTAAKIITHKGDNIEFSPSYILSTATIDGTDGIASLGDGKIVFAWVYNSSAYASGIIYNPDDDTLKFLTKTVVGFGGSGYSATVVAFGGNMFGIIASSGNTTINYGAALYALNPEAGLGKYSLAEFDGIALNAAASGGQVNVLLKGKLPKGIYSGLEIGRQVYRDSQGRITNTNQLSGPKGIAINTDVVIITNRLLNQ